MPHHNISDMKRLFIILALTIPFFLAAAPPNHVTRKLDRALDSLDTELRLRDHYIKMRHQRIDSITRHTHRKGHRPTARDLQRIGIEYRGFNSDSSLRYLKEGYETAVADTDTETARSILIDYSSLLGKTALFSEAIAVLDSIDPSTLSQTEAMHYYSILSQIHIDAADFINIHDIKLHHTNRAIETLRLLIPYFKKGSMARHLTEAQIYYLTDQAPLALGELNEIYDQANPSDPWFAMLTGMLAKYYKDIPERHEEYLYYLTLSSIADIRSANGEAGSLAQLGTEMYAMGDIDHAFQYLTHAGNMLSASGAQSMGSKMASPLSELAESINLREKKQTIGLIITIIVAILALIVLAGLLIKSQRRIKHKDTANDRLAESVSTRELYISRLLDLCAVYVEGFEDYNRLVGRKLKAGQAQDLYKIAESGSMLREQNERFYEVFDNTILSLFPNFVSEVNALLLPEKRITLPSADHLIPELRIIGFLRLGVTDSSRISKFLGLSLNTVYTYRNRMKSRAQNRDNFEVDVMKIGSPNNK